MNIAIIGGGNLGTAITEGLIKSQFAQPEEITVTKRNTASLKGWNVHGVQILSNNAEAVKNSQLIILAVKPYQIAAVLEGLRNALTEQHIVVSVITGVSIADLREMIQTELPLFRAMPNTAIAIQESITCISYEGASEEQVTYVTEMFNNIAKVANIDEKLMNAATVLGACGTA